MLSAKSRFKRLAHKTKQITRKQTNCRRFRFIVLNRSLILGKLACLSARSACGQFAGRTGRGDVRVQANDCLCRTMFITIAAMQAMFLLNLIRLPFFNTILRTVAEAISTANARGGNLIPSLFAASFSKFIILPEYRANS